MEEIKPETGTNLQKNDFSNHTDSSNEAQQDALKQFYFILTLVFIVLIIFLGFFIYNLIKCYLPKWRNKRELVNNENEMRDNSRRIEFEEI